MRPYSPPQTRRFNGETYHYYKMMGAKLAPTLKELLRQDGYKVRIVQDPTFPPDSYLYTKPRCTQQYDNVKDLYLDRHPEDDFTSSNRNPYEHVIAQMVNKERRDKRRKTFGKTAHAKAKKGFYVVAKNKEEAINAATRLAIRMESYGVKLFPNSVKKCGQVNFLTGPVDEWKVPHRKITNQTGKSAKTDSYGRAPPRSQVSRLKEQGYRTSHSYRFRGAAQKEVDQLHREGYLARIASWGANPVAMDHGTPYVVMYKERGGK